MKGVSWKSLLVCAAVACAACEQAAPPDEAPSSRDDDDGGESSPFEMSPIAKMLSKGMSEPGPYEAPEQSADFDAEQPHLVLLELDEPLSELESFSLFSAGGTTPMRSFQKKLRAAADDEQVEGVVLRSSGVMLSMSMAQDLRAALLAFKAEGKSLACHTENVSNATYYALTACDRLGLAPLGSVNIPGPSASPIHVKGLLERVGVFADFLHIGDFKGAAEPLTRDAPSEQMRQTLGAILEQSYETMVAGIAESRGLSEEAAKAAIDQAMFTGEQATEAGLVDEIATYEAFRDAVAGTRGWTRPKSKDANPLAQLREIQRFLGMVPATGPSEPHVAVVYAVGNIVDGEAGGLLGAREQVASRTLVPALRALARDEQVAAVVLRIDSPGGSALASEQIWGAASELAASKPLIVSMGSVAASGGYYIASPAKTIFARENTLTGSIGVVGGKIVVGEALRRVGVETYAMGRGTRASMWSPMRRWTDDERAGVRSMMEQTYEQFLARVSQGRDMERDAVHEVAQGRVWTGAAAKERGLVDEIGGLEDALAAAAEAGGVSVDAGLQVYPPEPTLRDVMAGLGPMAQASSQSLLSARLRALLEAGGLVLDPAGSDVHPELAALASLLHRVLLLQGARIWAVAWVAPPS